MSITTSPLTPFPRHISIIIILCLGSGFAANHVSARIAFDNGSGLLTAIIFRASLSFIALVILLMINRQSFYLPKESRIWQIILGLLITLQSLFIFSAVARVPVAIALLIANSFPILLALLTWILNNKRPSKQSIFIMGIIFIGLIWVLNIPEWFLQDKVLEYSWFAGISFAFGAACCFAIALWITEHKLAFLPGPIRSIYTISLVLILTIFLSFSSFVEGGVNLPYNSKGWIALILVGLLYTVCFIGLFVFAPRLNMATNAPAMNIEPVASLLLGWAFLNQVFDSNQLFGGAIVLSGIFSLAYLNTRK